MLRNSISIESFCPVGQHVVSVPLCLVETQQTTRPSYKVPKLIVIIHWCLLHHILCCQLMRFIPFDVTNTRGVTLNISVTMTTCPDGTFRFISFIISFMAWQPGEECVQEFSIRSLNQQCLLSSWVCKESNDFSREMFKIINTKKSKLNSKRTERSLTRKHFNINVNEHSVSLHLFGMESVNSHQSVHTNVSDIVPL